MGRLKLPTVGARITPRMRASQSATVKVRPNQPEMRAVWSRGGLSLIVFIGDTRTTLSVKSAGAFARWILEPKET